MRQEPPRPNRIHLLRTQLWAWAGGTGHREALRIGTPRSREAVPVIDLVHEPWAVALATLLGLLEQDRFEAPVLLVERGLDGDGTPFLHHENATAALGATCVALWADPASAQDPATGQGLLEELLGVWLIAAVADFPEAHEGYLCDLARGMGPAMIPQGWAGTLLHAGPGDSESLDGIVVALLHEAVVERAPGAGLRTVDRALEALDRAAGAERPLGWRHALAYVVGAELYNTPYGQLHAEYRQARAASLSGRRRRPVAFVEQEAIPAYRAVRD